MTAVDEVSRWAVVIPAYQHADDTIACLESVFAATPRPERVLVVDDGSGDDSVQRLQEWAVQGRVPVFVERDGPHEAPAVTRPGLTILAAATNAGFTLSSNRGLGRAVRDTDAAYVLLLNNDATVTPEFFAELYAATRAYPDAGLLTGTIYEWDRSTVWFAGGRISAVRGLAFNDTRSTGGGAPYETSWISGCAMLIARGVLEHVGALPVCFSPCYSEDVDYSLRAREAGFQLVLVPRAVAYHRVGASLGREGTERPAVTYVSTRNRVFVVRRNFHGWQRIAALGYLAVTKPARAAFETLRGRPRTGWAVLAGTVAGLFSAAARK